MAAPPFSQGRQRSCGSDGISPGDDGRPQRGSTQTIPNTNCGFPGGSAGDRRQFPGRCQSKRAHIASGRLVPEPAMTCRIVRPPSRSGTGYYRAVPRHPSKHGANMASSGPGSVATVRNCHCWRVSRETETNGHSGSVLALRTDRPPVDRSCTSRGPAPRIQARWTA